MQEHKRWKLKILFKAFLYPSALYIMAFIPGINLILYMRDSLGWTALMIAFPIALMIFLIDCIREQNKAMKKKRILFAVFSLVGYVGISYILGPIAEIVLCKMYGGKPTGVFSWAMTFPVSIILEYLGK